MIFTITIREAHTEHGTRYYPEADGLPFVYTVPGSSAHSIVSFGSREQAQQLLHTDPDKRTIVYMDVNDSREPFKVAPVMPYVIAKQPSVTQNPAHILFVSPTGAANGTERYFEEAMAAGYYGVDDAEQYAYKSA